MLRIKVLDEDDYIISLIKESVEILISAWIGGMHAVRSFTIISANNFTFYTEKYPMKFVMKSADSNVLQSFPGTSVSLW